MKALLGAVLLLGSLLLAVPGEAQQSQDFGNYVVHYNALNTNLLPPEVAKRYGINRSSARALLNVTVLKKVMTTPGSPVEAEITASGTNLTGQRREIEMEEIKEPDGAIYYIGVFPVHHLETYRFVIHVNIEEEAEPLVVKFRQQFFTE